MIGKPLESHGLKVPVSIRPLDVRPIGTRAADAATACKPLSFQSAHLALNRWEARVVEAHAAVPVSIHPSGVRPMGGPISVCALPSFMFQSQPGVGLARRDAQWRDVSIRPPGVRPVGGLLAGASCSNFNPPVDLPIGGGPSLSCRTAGVSIHPPGVMPMGARRSPRTEPG